MRSNEEGPKTMSHSNFTSKDSANAAEKSALTKEGSKLIWVQIRHKDKNKPHSWRYRQKEAWTCGKMEEQGEKKRCLENSRVSSYQSPSYFLLLNKHWSHASGRQYCTVMHRADVVNSNI